MISEERIQQLWYKYSDYVPGWRKRIAFARAIEAEVAAPLEAECGRLRAMYAKQSALLKNFDDVIDEENIAVTCLNPLEDLKQAIQALKTENEKLRDESAALALQNKQMRDVFQNVMVENSNSPLGTIALWRVSEALALPDLSISIIQQLDSEVIERCAEVCEKADRYRGDYFAEKLRALKK